MNASLLYKIYLLQNEKTKTRKQAMSVNCENGAHYMKNVNVNNGQLHDK